VKPRSSLPRLVVSGPVGLADELLLLGAPRAGTRAVLERGSAGSALRRAASFCLVVGVACSASLDRELLLPHVALTGFFWGFVPLLQALGCAAVAWVAGGASRPSLARLLDAHFAGNGPHWLAALAGAALSHVPADGAALRYGPAALLSLGALVWGGALTFVLYREGLRLSRGRAALLLALEWIVRIVGLLGWYAFMDNLLPQALGGYR
jgi:hypothetical protein